MSTNFYWRAAPEHQDDLTDLNKLPAVTLEAQIARKDADGKCQITVTLKNTSIEYRPDDACAIAAEEVGRSRAAGVL